MQHLTGELDDGSLRGDFDRRLNLEFHGSWIALDAAIRIHRELDDAIRLTDLAGAPLSESRRGTNTHLLLTGLLLHSVFGGHSGYQDVTDTDRLAHDSVTLAPVDCSSLDRAAFRYEMGRIASRWLTSGIRLAVVTDLSSAWTARV